MVEKAVYRALQDKMRKKKGFDRGKPFSGVGHSSGVADRPSGNGRAGCAFPSVGIFLWMTAESFQVASIRKRSLTGVHM